MLALGAALPARKSSERTGPLVTLLTGGLGDTLLMASHCSGRLVYCVREWGSASSFLCTHRQGV
jgi:hypothetical protein